MANKLEELPLYEKVMAFWNAVNALLEYPGFRKDRKLREQIDAANDSIPANMDEGFEQPTDAAFAQYVFHAKGSLAEVLARLRQSHVKRYITREELDERLKQGDALARMMAGFIRYLLESDFKDRGRHKLKTRDSR